MAAPIERKVTASSYTAAATGLILWALQTYVFKGDVPDVVVSWVYVLVPGIATLAAGYFTKHTIRLDLQEKPVAPPAQPVVPTPPT